jgi:hypothetical protein
MHGLLVKLHMSGDPAEYAQAFADYAHALNKRDGFVMKTWIAGDNMIGGFYIFEREESAKSYVDEMLVPTVDQFEVLSVEEIQHFSILDEYSAITHSPIAAVAAEPEPASLD